MGATGIEWTRGPNGEQGYTFNPWIGCTAVSGACANCYAETASIKFGVEWGPHGDRRGVSELTWEQPFVWDRRAARLGCRFRVFTASMADFLDNHRSIRDEWRARLYDTMVRTPNLDWLPLTKRPENAWKFLPLAWFRGEWPPNVWFGFTGEDQIRFDHCARHARAVPAPIRFVSVEPMLGKIHLPADVRAWLDWIICGGESGPLAKIRATPIAHMDHLAVQAQLAGIPFFMKQLSQISYRGTYKRFETFPVELQLRQQPKARISV